MKVNYWFKFLAQSFFLGLVGAASITGNWQTWPTLLIMGAYVTMLEFNYQRSKYNQELSNNFEELQQKFDDLDLMVKENRTFISNAQLNNNYRKR